MERRARGRWCRCVPGSQAPSTQPPPPALLPPHHRLHLVRTCTNPGGAKPVLLLLHGFPEAWHSWRRQMEALRGDWCVAALDMRGYGSSDKPKVGRARPHY